MRSTSVGYFSSRYQITAPAQAGRVQELYATCHSPHTIHHPPFVPGAALPGRRPQQVSNARQCIPGSAKSQDKIRTHDVGQKLRLAAGNSQAIALNPQAIALNPQAKAADPQAKGADSRVKPARSRRFCQIPKELHERWRKMFAEQRRLRCANRSIRATICAKRLDAKAALGEAGWA